MNTMSNGIPVDSQSFPFEKLKDAVLKEDIPALSSILQQSGLDTVALNKEISPKDGTLLQLACTMGLSNSVQELLKEDKVQVDRTDAEGQTVFHLASKRCLADTLTALCSSVRTKHLINTLSASHETPLHVLAATPMESSAKCVEILLSNGAVVDIRDNHSRTALELAKQFANIAATATIERFILEHPNLSSSTEVESHQQSKENVNDNGSRASFPKPSKIRADAPPFIPAAFAPPQSRSFVSQRTGPQVGQRYTGVSEAYRQPGYPHPPQQQGFRQNPYSQVTYGYKDMAINEQYATASDRQNLMSNNEDLLFGVDHVQSGIDFEKYDDIPVEASGQDVPKELERFTDVVFSVTQGEQQHGKQLASSLLVNLQKANYLNPTPIQKHAIPVGLINRDVMACAQTGNYLYEIKFRFR
eukprot:maker-scaffold_1-snap-gene-9.16-mRNA-1 protein AED:0.69 eAED:0.70 QI:0/0/0/0.33/1/1/3/0/415